MSGRSSETDAEKSTSTKTNDTASTRASEASGRGRAADPRELLQRSLGNQAVQRLAEGSDGERDEGASTEGEIGDRSAGRTGSDGSHGTDEVPGDIGPELPVLTTTNGFEREADRIARRAVIGGAPDPASRSERPTSAATPAATDVEGTAPSPVRDVVESSGDPLEPAVRAEMESALGFDTGPVRVHTGAKAARSARSIDARAYTFGNRIAFGDGEYAPDTPEGRHVLAHELAHVAQQRSSSEPQVQRMGKRDSASAPRIRGKHRRGPASILTGKNQGGKVEGSKTKGGKATGGKRTLEKKIEADSAEQGYTKFGRTLDNFVPMAGDQVAFDVKLSFDVPTGEGPDVTAEIALNGTAARGLDGAVTPGVPKLADNPDRLEMKASLDVKVGVGLATALTVKGGANFFLRAGGPNTERAIDVLSYGSFRYLNTRATGGDRYNLGVLLWGGRSRGRTTTKRQRAEEWAAMIEGRAFYRGAETFAGVGGGLTGSASAKANLPFGKLKTETEVGAATAKYYTPEWIESRMGADYFGYSPKSDAEARERQKRSKGKRVSEWSVTGTTEEKLGPTKAELVISGSGTVRGWEDWGVRVDATFEFPDRGVLKLLRGFLSTCWKTVVNVADKSSKASRDERNEAAESTALTGSQLPDAQSLLSDLSETQQPTGATVTLSLVYGRDGDGNEICRIELSEASTMGIDVDVSVVGVKATAKKTRLLWSRGFQDGEWQKRTSDGPRRLSSQYRAPSRWFRKEKPTTELP